MSAIVLHSHKERLSCGVGVSFLLPERRPAGEEKCKVGDPLRLRRPNGVEDSVQIGCSKF
jgi:hypothetical protein